MEKNKIKKILITLLCIPMIVFGQKTYIPDDGFEQALIDLGLDDVLDDSVNTSYVINVQAIYLNYKGIYLLEIETNEGVINKKLILQ